MVPELHQAENLPGQEFLGEASAMGRGDKAKMQRVEHVEKRVFQPNPVTGDLTCFAPLAGIELIKVVLSSMVGVLRRCPWVLFFVLLLLDDLPQA